MSSTAKATIKDLQPFNEWPGHPEHTTLFLIHELNNIDKHRLAHLACLWIATCGGTMYMKGNVTAADIDGRFEHVAERGVAQHGTPLLDVRWDAAKMKALPNTDMQMEIDISADVALRNPERAGFLDPDGDRPRPFRSPTSWTPRSNTAKRPCSRPSPPSSSNAVDMALA
jgi:hypothetical protein